MTQTTYPMCLLLGVLFMVCYHVCDSLLTPQQTMSPFVNSCSGNNCPVFRQQQQQQQQKQLAPPVTVRTALSMGLVENFVADSDEKTRNSKNEKYLAELQKRVDRINGLEETIEDLGDEELQAKTQSFIQRLQKGEDINGPLLEEAFAVVREAAW